jgi:tetratricopeptide (TPR) repeat protein
MIMKRLAATYSFFKTLILAAIRYRAKFFIVMGVLLMLVSCEQRLSPPEKVIRVQIDSLNVEFGKDLTYDSLKLTEIFRLIEVSDSVNYPEGVITLAVTASRIFMSNFKNAEALEMLSLAQQNLEITEDPGLEALVNFYFGKLNFRINNSDIALEYFLKAADLFLKSGDSVFYSKALTDIGNLHLDKGPLDRAKDYFEQAIEIDKKIYHLENLIVNYHQLSVYHHRKGDMDSAKNYLDRVFQLSKESKNQLLFAYYLANKASIIINNDNLDEGEKISFDALHLLDSASPGISPGQTRSIIYANLGILYEKRQNYDESIKYFNLALIDSLYNIVPELRIEFVYRLYKIYRQLGDHQLAYQTLDRYIKLRNMNDRAIADQNLLAMELKYNYKQLKKEHEHKQQRMKLILIISGLIVGFGVFVLILLNQKQRIKIRNNLLTKKIQDIKLERLNRELTTQALNMVRINERKIELIKLLKEKVPHFKRENQLAVLGIIDEFEKDKNESAWKEFELRFTEVYSEFYEKLSKINPNLTLNEKRLCAFLLLDMNTKEISSITGQSVRAIEQARVRLRKQLNLTNSNISITTFLGTL